MRTAGFVALLVGFILAGSPAAAQDAVAVDANARMAQGEQLFEAENYEAALVEFQAAYDALEGNPNRYLLLFNIGQCYERTFRYDRALSFYRRYLEEGGEAADGRTEVEATMRALEGLLGTLEIEANVPEASVWVDGLEVGTAPGTVLVPGGVHRVELRAAGHASAVQEVQVAARQTESLTFELEVLSDYEGIDVAAFGVTAGVAGATLVAGLVVGVVAWTDEMAVESDSYPDTNADRERVASTALTADVLYGVGGGIAVAAVVLAFVTDWDGPRTETATPVTVAPLVGPDVAGLAVGGAW